MDQMQRLCIYVYTHIKSLHLYSRIRHAQAKPTAISQDSSGKTADVLPPYVLKGRPNIPEIVGSAAQSALKREILDIGVFVCGPGALVDDSLKAAKMYSDPGTGTHVHVHAESFQM